MNPHLIEFTLLTASVWAATGGESMFKRMYKKARVRLVKDIHQEEMNIFLMYA